MPELMTPDEVAEALRLPLTPPNTYRRVRQALRELGVPLVRLGAAKWRVRRDDLKAALERVGAET